MFFARLMMEENFELVSSVYKKYQQKLTEQLSAQPEIIQMQFKEIKDALESKVEDAASEAKTVSPVEPPEEKTLMSIAKENGVAVNVDTPIDSLCQSQWFAIFKLVINRGNAGCQQLFVQMCGIDEHWPAIRTALFAWRDRFASRPQLKSMAACLCEDLGLKSRFSDGGDMRLFNPVAESSSSADGYSRLTAGYCREIS